MRRKRKKNKSQKKVTTLRTSGLSTTCSSFVPVCLCSSFASSFSSFPFFFFLIQAAKIWIGWATERSSHVMLYCTRLQGFILSFVKPPRHRTGSDSVVLGGGQLCYVTFMMQTHTDTHPHTQETDRKRSCSVVYKQGKQGCTYTEGECEFGEALLRFVAA